MRGWNRSRVAISFFLPASIKNKCLGRKKKYPNNTNWGEAVLISSSLMWALCFSQWAEPNYSLEITASRFFPSRAAATRGLRFLTLKFREAWVWNWTPLMFLVVVVSSGSLSSGHSQPYHGLPKEILPLDLIPIKSTSSCCVKEKSTFILPFSSLCHSGPHKSLLYLSQISFPCFHSIIFLLPDFWREEMSKVQAVNMTPFPSFLSIPITVIPHTELVF